MLFPTFSSASAPVRRSKSLSSVRTHHISPAKSESIDPETARQHALTAASLAFERAGQNETSSNMTRRNSISNSQAESQHAPVRRQSIRFAGPMAVPQRQLTRPRHSSGVKSNRAISPTSMATWKSTPHYLQSGPTSRSEVPEQTAVYDDESFTPLNDIASVPSSYRRIRKSKSMFDPRKPPTLYHNRALNNGHNKTQSTRLGTGTRGASLRLSKSISILGGRRNRIHQQSEQDQEAAVQMAREMYNQHVEGQYRDGLYSSVTPPSSRRRQGLFRRTARSSSDTNESGAIYSPNQRPYSSKPGFSTKARTFSASVKKRFKRVFHRSSGLAENIPVQHLEASRNHYDDSGNGGYDEASTPETRVFSNVTSGMPSIRAVSSNVEPRSRTGSIHSAQSEGEFSNGKSRVTSWTNSTAANTLATVHAAAVKRLSIIQEHGGPYQTSTSDSPHRTGNSPYSAFRGPMEGGTTPSHASDPIDSQRVYSALMKRLESNSPEVNTVSNNAISTTTYNGNYLDGASIPPRSSSMDSRQTNATIRRGPGRRLLDRLTKGHLDIARVTEDIVTPEGSPSQALVVSKNRAADENPPSPEKRVIETRLESDETLDTSRFPFGIPMIGRTFTEHDRVPSQGSEAASGSVYSRSIGGNTPKPTEGNISVHTSGNTHLGDPVSARDASDYHAPNATSMSERSSLTAKTSLEWKALNRFSQNHSQNARLLSPNPLSDRGHRRENAQINDGDTGIGSGKVSPGSRGVLEEYPQSRWSGMHQLSRQGSPLKELDVCGSNFMNLRPRQQRSPINTNALEGSYGAENEPPRPTDIFRSPNEIRAATSSLFSRSGSKSQGSLRASPDPADFLKSHTTPRTHSPGSVGARYSPERARRLAAYQRNRLSQRDDGGRSENEGFSQLQENQHGERAHTPTKEDVYDSNGTGLFELRADDPEMVDAYLRSRRQTYASTESQNDAFL